MGRGIKTTKSRGCTCKPCSGLKATSSSYKTTHLCRTQSLLIKDFATPPLILCDQKSRVLLLRMQYFSNLASASLLPLKMIDIWCYLKTPTPFCLVNLFCRGPGAPPPEKYQLLYILYQPLLKVLNSSQKVLSTSS